ncbi:Uncharacterized protein Fot_03279 [Forsythia ovata]|uniref:Uncharacterized protein n=1 Tax=Forsythia ovata TaxID=205694 RepID=A0ABD1X992_9LAMI
MDHHLQTHTLLPPPMPPPRLTIHPSHRTASTIVDSTTVIYSLRSHRSISALVRHLTGYFSQTSIMDRVAGLSIQGISPTIYDGAQLLSNLVVAIFAIRVSSIEH